jgi:catechol 2,3-dioxygenase-like lactoylglutathione lyase family enzyme
MIQRLHHTGFVVEELERAVEFYRDVVGLEVQARYERTGPGISKLIGYDGAHLRIALVGAGGDHNLELIQYVSPPPAQRPTEERSVLGASHLAFLVDDIQETFQRLVENGARKMNPPVELAPGRTACYLQDPDGNWIELLELREP